MNVKGKVAIGKGNVAKTESPDVSTLSSKICLFSDNNRNL